MFQDTVKEMLKLAQNYDKALEEEDKMTPEQLAIKNVGKQDPKRHLEDKVDVLMTTNIVQVRLTSIKATSSTILPFGGKFMLKVKKFDRRIY